MHHKQESSSFDVTTSTFSNVFMHLLRYESPMISLSERPQDCINDAKDNCKEPANQRNVSPESSSTVVRRVTVREPASEENVLNKQGVIVRVALFPPFNSTNLRKVVTKHWNGVRLVVTQDGAVTGLAWFRWGFDVKVIHVQGTTTCRPNEKQISKYKHWSFSLRIFARAINGLPHWMS